MKLKSLNIMKALVSALVLYALTFLVASALLFAITDANMFGAVILLLATILVIVVSKEYYFKGVKVKNPWKEGLALGVVYIAVMFALDVPIMAYGFAAADGWSYFTTWHMALGYLATLLAPVLVAYYKK